MVLDQGASGVVKCSPSGEQLLTIPTSYPPADVEIDSDGTIYVADYFSPRVDRYFASGVLLGAFFAPTDMARADLMAFDVSGTLYAANMSTQTIEKISPTGVHLGTFASGLGNAYGVAFDPDGNLYVADYSGKIHKLLPTGTELGIFATAGLVTPRGVLVYGMEVPPVPVLEAAIRIKPGSSSAPINPKSRGKIPVAILSSTTFDAPAHIDQSSLTVGPTGEESSLTFCDAAPEDVNADGFADLPCHFYTQTAALQIGSICIVPGK